MLGPATIARFENASGSRAAPDYKSKRCRSSVRCYQSRLQIKTVDDSETKTTGRHGVAFERAILIKGDLHAGDIDCSDRTAAIGYRACLRRAGGLRGNRNVVLAAGGDASAVAVSPFFLNPGEVSLASAHAKPSRGRPDISQVKIGENARFSPGSLGTRA